MFIFRNAEINGICLNGSEPISPEIREFLERKGAKIKQKYGFFVLYGNFNFSLEDVKNELHFLSPKSKTYSGLFLPANTSSTVMTVNAGIGMMFNADICTQRLINLGIYVSFNSLRIRADNLTNRSIFSYARNSIAKLLSGTKSLYNAAKRMAIAIARPFVSFVRSLFQSPPLETKANNVTYTSSPRLTSDVLTTDSLSPRITTSFDSKKIGYSSYGVSIPKDSSEVTTLRNAPTFKIL